MGNIEEAIRRIDAFVLGNKLEKILNLSSLRLTTEDLELLIPTILGKIPNLQRLNLNGNELRKIPESMVGLNSLQHLSLNNNELEDIGFLENLTQLKNVA
jgi:Leucine-rich repeat (LRR) protein